MILKKTIQCLKLLLVIASKKKIVFAISGGVDSISLFFLIKKYFKKNANVVSIDHNLRQDAHNECFKLQQYLIKKKLIKKYLFGNTRY